LGRSQEQVERECLTLIAVLLILGPILFLSKPERDSVQQARVKWQSDMRLLSIVDLVQAENRAVERTSFFDILSPEVELSKMGLAEAFLAKHTRETHAPPVFGDSRNG
jgi:hypothetical protein